MKNKILFFIATALFINLAAHSQLITMSVDATKQGKFKGESIRNNSKEKSEIIGYLYEITSPRDVATGQASGKRAHQPVLILKPFGASSPQFFQALTTNEVLKTVVFDFYKTNENGEEINYYTVTLTNAIVSSYKQFIGPLDNEKFNPANTGLYDEIKFTFQKITVEDKVGKTMSTDDWFSR